MANTHLKNKINLNSTLHMLLPLIMFSIPLSTSITNILMTIFLLLWIIDGNYLEKLNFSFIRQYKACLMAILLFLSLFFGCLYSNYASFIDILILLKKMAKLIYLPFFIYYFRNYNTRNYAINAFIASSLITTILGLFWHSISPFKNTIDISLVTVIACILLLHKIELTKTLYYNITIIVLSLLNIFYLFYYTAGRTSQAIFLLLIPIFLLQRLKANAFNNSLKIKNLLFILPIIITIIIGIGCGFYSKQLNENWHSMLLEYRNYNTDVNKFNHSSLSYRLTFYKNSLALIKQKPLFGWGTGSFNNVYQKFAKQHYGVLTPNPHNEYLLWGVQLGIGGIILLMLWFYNLFKTSFILPNYEKYILQNLIIIFIIGCLANSWLLDFVAGHLFIIITAIALGALPNDARTSS